MDDGWVQTPIEAQLKQRRNTMLANTQAPGYGTGAGWKSKKNKKPSSSTPGIMKGDNCQATPLQKGMAKHNRAYRWDPVAYQSFRQTKTGRNV